jgi:hypothetical protein
MSNTNQNFEDCGGLARLSWIRRSWKWFITINLSKMLKLKIVVTPTYSLNSIGNLPMNDIQKSFQKKLSKSYNKILNEFVVDKFENDPLSFKLEVLYRWIWNFIRSIPLSMVIDSFDLIFEKRSFYSKEIIPIFFEDQQIIKSIIFFSFITCELNVNNWRKVLITTLIPIIIYFQPPRFIYSLGIDNITLFIQQT